MNEQLGEDSGGYRYTAEPPPSKQTKMSSDIQSPESASETNVTAHETSEPHSTKGLLELPAELRNNIWHLVVGPESLHTDTLLWEVDYHGKPRGRVPPLLHTCKQIRGETPPIFYSQVTIDGPEGLSPEVAEARMGLDEIATTNLKAVRLTVVDGREMQYLRPAENLNAYRAILSNLGFHGKIEFRFRWVNFDLYRMLLCGRNLTALQTQTLESIRNIIKIVNNSPLARNGRWIVDSDDLNAILWEDL